MCCLKIAIAFQTAQKHQRTHTHTHPAVECEAFIYCHEEWWKPSAEGKNAENGSKFNLRIMFVDSEEETCIK